MKNRCWRVVGMAGWALLLASFPTRALATSWFSPGALSRGHAHLEGLSNCQQCHAKERGVDPALCAGCHVDVANDRAHRTGLHGQPGALQAACESCHHEHLGQDADILGLPKDLAHFEHALTGYALVGRHAEAACAACHRAPLQSKVRAETKAAYTGLSQRCSGCHADVHRGQLAAECQACHTPKGFAPATNFSHDSTAYPLTGQHRSTACAGCHKSERAGPTLTPALLGGQATQVVRYKPVAHQACTDCHADVHRGQMHGACTDCHTTKSWEHIEAKAADRSFHATTRFPLTGAHTKVACASCHGPWPGRPAQFAPLPHARCSDCHADGHMGQLGAAGQACERCHSVTSFADISFSEADHQQTRYPLRGGHKAVACNACHRQDPALRAKVPAKVVRARKRAGRPLLVSAASFVKPVSRKRCDTCHRSPHGSQFAAQIERSGCADCHRVQSFAPARFDHAKETPFQLDGAHAQVACASCHQPAKDGEVVYTGLPSACASCHRDVHAGQFVAPGGEPQACESCHNTAAFAPSTFVHHKAATPSPTAAATNPFVLVGKHRDVACNACHRTVALPGTHIKTVQYKEPHDRCEACHQDQHRGALDQLPRMVHGQRAPRPDGHAPRCTTCHTQSGWLPSHYKPHERLTFRLEGGHRDVACRACHSADFAPTTPTVCNACHQDAHAGEFGAQCSACHTTASWQADFDVWAHRLTNFPLRGAHGAIPCQECHPGAYANNFRGTAVSCDGCHLADYQKTALTGLNHVAGKFSLNCRSCHEPWQWQRAVFAEHEACFPIASGAHAAIACAACHSSLVGKVANGSCSTGTATCTSCHTHAPAASAAQHADVPSFRYDDRACQSCHGRGQ